MDEEEKEAMEQFKNFDWEKFEKTQTEMVESFIPLMRKLIVPIGKWYELKVVFYKLDDNNAYVDRMELKSVK